MTRLYVYSTSEHTIGAWLQYSDKGGDHSVMVFRSYDDMIQFIVNMGIQRVAVVEYKQDTVPYSMRLDIQNIQDSIALAQSKRKGMKRIITVYSTALQSPI